MSGKSWNGTPFTDRQKKKHTIDGRLNRHTLFICTVIVLMSVCLFLVMIVYTRIYNRMIDSVCRMETMFEKIEELRTATVAYVFSESEEGETEIGELFVLIRSDITELQTLPAGDNYQRNLTDLGILIDSYEELEKRVIQKRDQLVEDDRTQEIVEETLEEYNEMETVHVTVMRRKDMLNESLSTYLNRQNQNLQRELFLFCGTILAAFFAGLGLVWQNTRQLAHEIASPVKRLTAMARKVSDEDLDGIVPEEEACQKDTVTELEVLAHTFHTMLCRIQEQVTKLKEAMVVREQLKEQELENLRMANLLTTSELQCLQMQMNPHFLFNTLNMIQQTIYLDKKEKSSFLLKETAAFLRYSLDYAGKNVTLQKELEALGNYISLQEERLGERILFEFELDESVHKLHVPSLILQPLVENSLIHGVADKRSGALICIRTESVEQQQYARISIEDNGHGMSPERLEEVQKKMDSTDGPVETSIGLPNVYRRLRLFSSGAARMRIESEPEVRTSVMIELPFVRNQGQEVTHSV